MKKYSTCPNTPDIFGADEYLRDAFATYCKAKIDTEKGLQAKDIRAIHSLVIIEEMMTKIEADFVQRKEYSDARYIQLSAEARELKHEIFN